MWYVPLPYLLMINAKYQVERYANANHYWYWNLCIACRHYRSYRQGVSFYLPSWDDKADLIV
jgi:hypothetical protein